MKEKRAARYVLFGILLALVMLNGAVAHAALGSATPGALRVSFLDVGQGDAIFIETPSGQQVLIDGGESRAVLRQLGEILPWYDREIDLVVATHPDADHIGGLVDVLERFDIRQIVLGSVVDDGEDAVRWRDVVLEEEAVVHEAKRGDVFNLGDGVRLEILFPDRSVPNIETNTGSIVARLRYGDTAFMLTGDAPAAIEAYLVALDGARLRSDVLKAGHHGSRTSSSLLFVGYVDPTYAVLSYGCGNSYGHPHQEVVETFERFESEVVSTCEDGTVTFISDGHEVRLK